MATLDPILLFALRTLAEQAARAGGELAARRFGQPISVRRKADGSEVTDIDEDAQRVVIDVIRAQRPHDDFIGEETLHGDLAGRAMRADVAWIIDPIDGTRNYIRGVPLYACSVAAAINNTPVAGAIYWPPHDQLFSAYLGGDLLVNGKPYDAQRATGMNPKPVAAIPSNSERSAEALVRAWVGRVVLRTLGSTVLHLALAATGQFEAVLLSDSKLWDVAAGWVLLQASGGLLNQLDGSPMFPLDLATYDGESLPGLGGRDPAIVSALPRTA